MFIKLARPNKYYIVVIHIGIGLNGGIASFSQSPIVGLTEAAICGGILWLVKFLAVGLGETAFCGGIVGFAKFLIVVFRVGAIREGIVMLWSCLLL